MLIEAGCTPYSNWLIGECQSKDRLAALPRRVSHIGDLL